ncbi:Glycosyltransferase [Winogradskyella psychrotolerans RS-3]|uniref:Glycosyltransferase n=2 Tax=Winogradskyella TaxID=286104 RepID=S7VXC9_9FLAO|nr:Glycosyltransferase [Winogradskyella psychrotolerans RS-3]
MSVYNGELYLAEAIESILSQTYTDFEFIIYEDCSTDNSLSILQDYEKQDKRITVIVNEKNKGLTANLIDGVNTAKGTYLARMDADDISLPKRLEKQVYFLENHKDVVLLGSSVIFFDNNGNEFVAYQPTEHNEIKIQLLLGFTLLHPSVMLRTKAFHDHKLNYNPEFRYAQDHDLWARTVMVGLKTANIYEPLIKMREHANKISTTLKPKQQYYSNQTRLLQLNAYGITLGESELMAFHNLTSGKANFELLELKTFEKALLNIVREEQNVNGLNHNILSAKVAEIFRLKCRELMINKKNGAWLYWQSPLRKYDNMTKSNQMTFFVRSLKTFLQF